MKVVIAENRVHVMKKGTKKSLFTMHCVVFDPRKALTGDQVKRRANRGWMHISNKKLKENYDVIYALATKEKMGRKKVWVFKPVVKPDANTIFVIPKKYRKEARKAIMDYFF